MADCGPCKHADSVLTELQSKEEGDGLLPFELQSFNINSKDFKERRDGKRLLTKYATMNVPFIIFEKDGKDIVALYKEELNDKITDFEDKFVAKYQEANKK